MWKSRTTGSRKTRFRRGISFLLTQIHLLLQLWPGGSCISAPFRHPLILLVCAPDPPSSVSRTLSQLRPLISASGVSGGTYHRSLRRGTSSLLLSINPTILSASKSILVFRADGRGTCFSKRGSDESKEGGVVGQRLLLLIYIYPQTSSKSLQSSYRNISSLPSSLRAFLESLRG